MDSGETTHCSELTAHTQQKQINNKTHAQTEARIDADAHPRRHKRIQTD